MSMLDRLCNPGYEKTLSYETLGCSNIEEFLSRTHTCVANSFCIDTEGSFECECEPGFEGYPEVEVGIFVVLFIEKRKQDAKVTLMDSAWSFTILINVKFLFDVKKQTSFIFFIFE